MATDHVPLGKLATRSPAVGYIRIRVSHISVRLRFEILDDHMCDVVKRGCFDGGRRLPAVRSGRSLPIYGQGIARWGIILKFTLGKGEGSGVTKTTRSTMTNYHNHIRANPKRCELFKDMSTSDLVQGLTINLGTLRKYSS